MPSTLHVNEKGKPIGVSLIAEDCSLSTTTLVYWCVEAHTGVSEDDKIRGDTPVDKYLQSVVSACVTPFVPTPFI